VRCIISGRIHIFMLPEDCAKFDEIIEILGVGDDQFGESHAAAVALEYVMDQIKFNKLTDEQLKEITDVQDPPNFGHAIIYLREVTVKTFFRLLVKHKMEHHDYALSHLITHGIRMLYDALKQNTLKPTHLEFIKIIKKPKTVYHT